jgi:FlaA1/EpsC-like NDP-sugar epimerase
MTVFHRHVSGRGIAVFGFETMLISGSILLAARGHGACHIPLARPWRIALVTVVCELCFYYNDLYDLTLVHSKTELVVRVLQSAGAAAIVLAVVTALIPALIIGHGILITSLCLLLVAVPIGRLAFDGLAHGPHLEERILILGSGRIARTLARQIFSQHDFAYRVVGFVQEDPEQGHRADPLTLGTAADLPSLIARHQIDRVIVGLTDRRGRMPIRELLQAKLSGVRVEDAATTYERITGKILLDDLKPSWFIFSDGCRAARGTRLVKRAVDVILASIGLLCAAPLMLLTATCSRSVSSARCAWTPRGARRSGRRTGTNASPGSAGSSV